MSVYIYVCVSCCRLDGIFSGLDSQRWSFKHHFKQILGFHFNRFKQVLFLRRDLLYHLNTNCGMNVAGNNNKTTRSLLIGAFLCVWHCYKWFV